MCFVPSFAAVGTIAAGATTTTFTLSTALGTAVGTNMLANRGGSGDYGFKIRIIDTTAGTSAIDENRMAAVAAFMRADPQAGSRGPLAFVVDPKRGDQAQKFADLTADERPVKVFTSLREARKWVRENMKTAL